MSVDAAHQYRGVLCRRCGKPVKVPALVMKKDVESHGQLSSDDMEYHLISQVFVLRCRSCHKESVYSMNQIVDITLTTVAAAGGASASA